MEEKHGLNLYILKITQELDIVYDPSNFNIHMLLFGKERNAWNFLGSGSNSGIYKTIDGGKTGRKYQLLIQVSL